MTYKRQITITYIAFVFVDLEILFHMLEMDFFYYYCSKTGIKRNMLVADDDIP